MFLVYTVGAVISLTFGYQAWKEERDPPSKGNTSAITNMAAQTELLAPALMSRSDVPVFPPVALSAEAAPFTPLGTDGWRLGSPSDVEKQFSRCAAKLRALRADSGQLREELNLLFDQLLSENYNKTFDPNINIRPEVTHTLFGLAVTTVFNLTCDTANTKQQANEYYWNQMCDQNSCGHFFPLVNASRQPCSTF